MVARMDQNHIPNNKPPILESDYGNVFVMRIRPSSGHRARNTKTFCESDYLSRLLGHDDWFKNKQNECPPMPFGFDRYLLGRPIPDIVRMFGHNDAILKNQREYNKQNNQNTGDNMNEQNSMLNDLKKLFRYNDSNDANSLTTEQQINMLKQNHALLREKMDAECEYYDYRKRLMIEYCQLFCEMDTKKQKFIDNMIAIEQTIKLLGGKMDAPDEKKSDDDGDDE